MSFASRLTLPEETPSTVAWAVLFYLAHLVCQAWVASSEGFGFLALALFSVAVIRREIRLSFHILYYPLFVYGIASSLSAFNAGRAIHAFGENALWFKMLLFPMALVLFREVPRSRTLALRAMLAFGAYSAFWGLFQYFVLEQKDLDHRITGQAAHVMTFSGLILPSALMFLVLWLHSQRSLWLVTGGAVTTLALVMTFTRSAWLGWVAGIFTLLLFTKPRWMFYGAVALLYVVILAPVPLFGRFMSTFNTRQSSNLDRIRMAEAGVEIIKDDPLFGVGPANMKQVYPLYRKHDAPRFRIPHLHNNIIQIWAERGVIALAAYLLFIGLALRACAMGWHSPGRRFAEMGVAVIIGLSYAGLFEFNWGDTEVFLFLLDIVALVVAMTEPEVAPANAMASLRVAQSVP